MSERMKSKKSEPGVVEGVIDEVVATETVEEE